MTPTEIDDFCKRLAEAWKMKADYELGDLIQTAISCGISIEAYFDLNLMSNDDLLTAIEKFCEGK